MTEPRCHPVLIPQVLRSLMVMVFVCWRLPQSVETVALSTTSRLMLNTSTDWLPERRLMSGASKGLFAVRQGIWQRDDGIEVCLVRRPAE